MSIPKNLRQRQSDKQSSGPVEITRLAKTHPASQTLDLYHAQYSAATRFRHGIVQARKSPTNLMLSISIVHPASQALDLYAISAYGIDGYRRPIWDGGLVSGMKQVEAGEVSYESGESFLWETAGNLRMRQKCWEVAMRTTTSGSMGGSIGRELDFSTRGSVRIME
ncbi:MAG: hypothetical protein Q9204_007022 [Flavoplaca sp. TL-2023a]